MTVPTARNWASSNAIPQTQNTAPVLEFQCLYTSDLRRKQKRWQDGRLKYHTFNKRIMVYDDRSNFVGDSHWHEDRAFGEGEEVELERCGILVEVSECVGTREQDLTPILNKALKDRQERAHVPAVASSPLRPPGPAMRMQTVGRLRAEPTERSAKRRKPNSSPSSKKGYAQNLTGATLALSGIPSTATPLRYDAGWLRTMKQPIEEIDMSSSAGVNRVSPERPVPIRKGQTKVGGSQAKRLSKRPSPTSVNSGHARKFTRAALVLASKTLTGRGLPPAVGIAKKPPNRLGQSDTAATTMEEEEFMDIDIYDKENQRVEQAMASSSPVTDLVKDHRKKPLPDPLSHQLYSEGGQPERPFNPLRIRARPKTKLLSTAKPPSRLPLFNERGNGIICPKIGREMLPSMAPMSQARSVTETMPLNVKERCLSSLLDSGLDHHGIDVLLTRKVSGQTSDAEELQANLRPFTKDLSYTQSAEDSKDPVGSEGQERALSSISPGPQLDLLQKTKQIRREWSMFRGNTETEIEKARIKTRPSNNLRSPPRSIKSFSEGAQAYEFHGMTIITNVEDSKILRPTYQDIRDLPVKRDIIPFKPPAKLACPAIQGTNLAQRVNKRGGYDENVMPPVITSTRPAVPIPKAKMDHKEAVPGRDQGPWSREAFDLFDWKPGAATTGDSLAAG